MRHNKSDGKSDAEKITVEIVFAGKTSLFQRRLQVDSVATVIDVVRQSGVLNQHPEIDLTACGFGIFGEVAPPDATVYEGARIEIYKPLLCTPVEARRRLADKPKPVKKNRKKREANPG